VISHFSKDALLLDARAEVDRIVDTLRKQVLGTLHRRGVVVGLSGGIDSSVVATLCTRAFGKDKVLGLFMPERDSSGDSLRLGRRVSAQLGIENILEDIGPAVEAVGAYRRQLEAIRTVVPDYGDGWKCKLVIEPVLASNGLNITRLTVQDPEGKVDTVRLSPPA
jgi:NAD+ synthase